MGNGRDTVQGSGAWALARIRAAWADLSDGHDPPADDRARVAWAGGRGADTYGELHPEAFLQLLEWYRPGPDDVFADFGSGTGKLAALAVLASGVGRAVGVELSGHRHRTALQGMQRLTDEADCAGVPARLEYLEGDFRERCPRELTIAFTCATAFPDALNDAAGRTAAQQPHCRAFATTRPLTHAHLLGFEELGRMDLPASWSPRVGVFLYRRRQS